MRGRKNNEEFSNSNVERSSDNELNNAELNNNNNFDLVKTLNNFLKMNNNNGNLEDSLNVLDQTIPAYALGQSTNNGQLNLHRTGYEPFKRYPLFNTRPYGSGQVTPFLGLMSARYGAYGSPKRAGFVPVSVF